MERFIERRKLDGAKYKCLATDYASPRVVDVRVNEARKADTPWVRSPAPDGSRVERLKQNFQTRVACV